MGKNSDISVEDFERLVWSVVNRYKGYGVPQEDLFQEGMMGILEAKERFDSERGVAFSTYSTFWIKKRIIDALNRERKESLDATEFIENTFNEEPVTKPEQQPTSEEETIELPVDFPEDEKRLLKLHFEKRKTLNEIAEILGWSREKVRQIKQKALRRMKLTKR